MLFQVCSQIYFLVLDLCLNIIMCFPVLDFGLDIVLKFTFLSWIFSLTLFQVCFLILDLYFGIVSSVLPCHGWYCLKFASLSWIFALTSFQMCFLVLDFGLNIVLSFTSLCWIFLLILFQVCFLVLDLCLNIISNVLPCPEISLWHCSESYLSWIFTLTLSQVCFLVLDLCLNIVDSVRRLDLEGNSLAGQGLDENLHTAAETQDKMQSWLLLNVVIGQSTAVLKLLARKDQTLLVRRNTKMANQVNLSALSQTGIKRTPPYLESWPWRCQ